MRKKNDTLQQFEQLLEEMRQTNDESAATAVAGKKRSKQHSGTLFKLFFRFWGVKLLFVIILLIFITAVSVWAFSGSTAKKDSTTFVEHVQELATLATAEAHLKVVIEQVDNKIFGNEISFNFPGTKREVLLIVPTTVIAGVDLKGIHSTDIKINEKKNKIMITLPRANLLQDPTIVMDEVIAFSDTGLFRGEVKWEEGFDLAAEAQKKAEEEAIEIGLLESAEENAIKVLEEFFASLGYDVQVDFK